MAGIVTNLDDVIKDMAKLDKSIDLIVIREIRKKMRAIMRSLIPTAKSITPQSTGSLANSIRVKSRSRRGISSAQLVWDLKKKKSDVKEVKSFGGIKLVKDTNPGHVNYGGFVNFKKGQSGEKFATDNWEQQKSRLDQEAITEIKQVMKNVLQEHGIEVK